MSDFLTFLKKLFRRNISLFSNGSFTKKTILCVDDDPAFSRYLEKIAETMGLGFDKAFSFQEAVKKIEAHADYFAYIIDGHLPDGSGFDLAKEIREKRGHSAPIGFISRVYQDAASFRILKEQLKVDYVLQKPLTLEDMKTFLRSLCELEDFNKIPFSEEILSDLNKQYDATIGEKIERLEKLILTVQSNPSEENLLALKQEVHKIAGSAGSYGYQKVSTLCASEDEQIKNYLIHPSGIPPKEEWLNSLDDFYSQVKLHFQIKS